ncbi:MAG: bifunctional diaminohydroxyphosphoribosylaminopyrimidine deaminase/5-amino-6-(5-phosphoribosylamino)uracil reductase RibD [Alistipes sp.]|nr:bifunctional diaminohydroxyphosphoribosylaminopyrimidine deaminase/5-amino-6-(5-phosphoribosylamino)uracil reductase RibD [Alistipes sp.]
MFREEFMAEALSLAKKGMGFTSPNPMVGAVIVRDGEIIGRGYHRKCGGLHAERNAFADCDSRGVDCRGADMYVTLEPCCHFGRTPPCTEAIIEHGISRVFIGSSDPNPLVSGKGAKILREHGTEVFEGILKEKCDAANKIFFHYITTGLPFVTMKYAMTADGKIACFTGDSRWITGEEARLNVQRDRLRHSAIMVGVGTVLADDPMLTCRLENGRDPVRIICDTNLRTPLDCNIVRTAADIPTIIAHCHGDGGVYEKLGCQTVVLPERDGHVDLKALMEYLGKERHIDSVLLEGGGELNYSALSAGIVNSVQTYIAPKIFGGADARSPVEGAGVPHPGEAFMLVDRKLTVFGGDILIESRVEYVHGNN